MSKLPEPRGWKILIRKQIPKEETSGGVILPDSAIEAESYMTICSEVVKIGPKCWRDRETGKHWYGDDWAKPGDWVITPKFTQFKMKIDGEEYRFINDDEIIAVVSDPKAIKVFN